MGESEAEIERLKQRNLHDQKSGAVHGHWDEITMAGSAVTCGTRLPGDPGHMTQPTSHKSITAPKIFQSFMRLLKPRSPEVSNSGKQRALKKVPIIWSAPKAIGSCPTLRLGVTWLGSRLLQRSPIGEIEIV